MPFDVFFMNHKALLMTVTVEITEGDGRTPPVDTSGKATMVLEELMAEAHRKAAQKLYSDIQANGLGSLMGIVMQQAAELGSAMGQAG